MQNKVIIFDVDHTLFDTDRYLDSIFTSLAEILPDMNKEEIVSVAKETYIKLREVDVFHPLRFADMLQKHLHRDLDTYKIVQILEDTTMLASCLYSDVYETLEQLSKESSLTLAIFSTGDRELQIRKIQAIHSFFRERDIHIYPLKDVEIPQVLAQYKDKKIFVIDDHVRVLAEFAKENVVSTKIWITRPGVMHNDTEQDYFMPDQHISVLSELLSIVE